MPGRGLVVLVLTLAAVSVTRLSAADEAPATLAVDSAASQVAFTVFTSMIFKSKQEGRFKDFKGEVAYDAQNPAATRVDLTVYTASVDMKNRDRDDMLRSPDFFDADRFPTLRFVSKHVGPLHDNMLSVTGDLTIHGITHEVTVPVSIDALTSSSRRPGPAFSTTFQIDRTEFGLNGSPKFSGFNISVAKNVQIHLAIVAAPPRP